MRKRLLNQRKSFRGFAILHNRHFCQCDFYCIVDQTLRIIFLLVMNSTKVVDRAWWPYSCWLTLNCGSVYFTGRWHSIFTEFFMYCKITCTYFMDRDNVDLFLKFCWLWCNICEIKIDFVDMILFDAWCTTIIYSSTISTCFHRIGCNSLKILRSKFVMVIVEFMRSVLALSR